MTFPVPLTGWPLSHGAGDEVVIIKESPTTITYPALLVANPQSSGGYIASPEVASQEPNLGEIWQIEAFLYTIALSYEITVYVNISEDYNKLSEQYTVKEAQETLLKSQLPLLQNIYNAEVKNKEEAELKGETLAARQFAQGLERLASEKVGVEQDIKSVQSELANILRERAKLGEAESAEILQEASIGVRASISTPTGGLTVVPVSPLFRRLAKPVSAPFYEQTELEREKIGVRRAVATEYYTDRVDLQNPPTVRPTNQITGDVQFITPYRTASTLKELEGRPWIEQLYIAIPQYVLQVSQVGTLSREGNP